MKFCRCILLQCLALALSPLGVLAQVRGRYAQNILNQQQLESSLVEKASAALYHPVLDMVLYTMLLAALGGIFFKQKRLIFFSLSVITTLLCLRFFVPFLLGPFSIFKAAIIIPIFLVTMAAKWACDYFKYKKEDGTVVIERKKSPSLTTHKTRGTDNLNISSEGVYQTRNVYKSASLKLDSDSKSTHSGSASTSVKLSRPF